MTYFKNMYQIYIDDDTRERYKNIVIKKISKNLNNKDLILKIAKGQTWLTNNWETKENEEWYKGLMLYEALCDEAHNRKLDQIERESWVGLAAKILEKKSLKLAIYK